MVLLVYPIGILFAGIVLSCIILSGKSEKQKLIEKNERYLEQNRDVIEEIRRKKTL